MFAEAYDEPKSVDEMMARYAAIKKRTYQRKPFQKQEKKTAEKKTVRIDRPHNAHVLAYKEHMRVQEILSHYRAVSTPQGYGLSVSVILEEVARKHGVTVAEIKGKGRYRRVAAARHEAAARIYTERPDLSLPAIGRLMGGRDHTTILHSVRKMGAYIEDRGGRSKHRNGHKK